MTAKPRGVLTKGGMVKLATTFEPELFDKLKKRSRKQHKTFSAIVNDVVKCGLLCIEESERDDELPAMEVLMA